MFDKVSKKKEKMELKHLKEPYQKKALLFITVVES
jgi:hypothetical protein